MTIDTPSEHEVGPGRRAIGRPRKSAQENERTRRRIIDAAGRIYAAHGHRGVTVARVIERAGISRGLFYKHFRNATEPIETLLGEIHAGLTPGILTAAMAAQTPIDKIAAGVDAYLDWAEGLGPLLRPVSRELHDTGSPLSAIRAKVQDALVDPIRAAVDAAGLPAPSRYEVQVVIGSLEIACFLGFSEPGIGRDAARATMIRLALAALRIPDEPGPDAYTA